MAGVTPKNSERATIEALLSQQRYGEALTRARSWVAGSPRDVSAHATLAAALLATGRLNEAGRAASSGLKLAPADPQLHLVQAVIDHRLARSDAAIDRLSELLARRPQNEVDVAITLFEVLHRKGDVAELGRRMAVGGAWENDERAQVFLSRVLARTDGAVACDQLARIAYGTGKPSIRRIAGFEAVRLHDAAGRYREAFALATDLHRSTTPQFDIGGVELEVAEQLRGLSRLRPVEVDLAATHRGASASFVVGLPRSGTTLLEQMLDRHPSISGIGEYEGAFTIRDSLVGSAHWPTNLRALKPADALQLATDYLQGATDRQRVGATMTFDKTLDAWRMLPALAAVLPSAAYLHITRDARDCAISMFLSNFHPVAWGFTRDLAMIRRIIELERSIVAAMFAALKLRAASMRYEDLVDDPEREIRRALDLLGMPWDSAVLSPEQNQRTVLTLSHDQVRRKINRSSIGRWKNYEFAFDDSWNSLSALAQ